MRCFFCLEEDLALDLVAPVPGLLELGLHVAVKTAWHLVVFLLFANTFVLILVGVLLDSGAATWREVLGIELEGGLDDLDWADPNEARIVTYENKGRMYF